MRNSVAIKKIRSEMFERGIIAEDVNPAVVDFYLDMISTISWENRGRELTAHNKKKIAKYNRQDKLIQKYDSITEAARLCKLNRDVIDDSLSGRTQYTRKGGYYFRYINNGTPEDNS